jgi:hypothetical protein
MGLTVSQVPFRRAKLLDKRPTNVVESFQPITFHHSLQGGKVTRAKDSLECVVLLWKKSGER